MESVRNRRHAIYREAIQVGIGAPPVLHRYHAQSAEAAADGTVIACAGSAACAPAAVVSPGDLPERCCDWWATSLHGATVLRAGRHGHASHKEQANMIHRYIIWRNNHAYDERLRRIVDKADVT
jgi:hypothetical protein